MMNWEGGGGPAASGGARAVADLSTGYYGIPGRFGGEVHVVRGGSLARRGAPVCGTIIDRRAEYQWCARGVVEGYVECLRCRAWIARNRQRLWPAAVPPRVHEGGRTSVARPRARRRLACAC